MQARNPKYNQFGTIDLEIEHPNYGWIPYTADPSDPLCADIHAKAVNGEYGSIALYAPPALMPAQTLARKKKERQATVDAITVTVSTGKIFDGNEEAQSRMARAIQAAQIASISTTTWVLSNNVPTTVTLAELQEALVLSMQAMGAVWAVPYQ